MKKLIPIIALLAVVGVASYFSVANSQTSYLGVTGGIDPIGIGAPVTTTPITPWCRGFTHNLQVGSTDVNTNTEVSALQNFLVARGFLHIPNGLALGYFGNLTRAALIQFQTSAGISAAGRVGPITRGYFTQYCRTSTNTPRIDHISPTSGQIGTLVRIYGRGFSANSMVKFGNGYVRPNPPMDCPSTNCSSPSILTFTVPQYLQPCNPNMERVCMMMAVQVTPGTYSVTVMNQNGDSSNAASFTVGSSSVSNNQNPTITGLSAPTYLSVNQTGTWQVSVQDSTGGNLTYTADWGEAGASANAVADYNQTGTFTHSYHTAGNYTATFTVRNSSGGMAQTSATVQVGQISSNGHPVSLTYLSPTSGPVGTSVTIHGSGFTSSNNSIYFDGGVIMSQASVNGGTNITFTIPASINPPCYYASPRCLMPSYLINPGTYPVYVTNSNGTSNTLYLTVTSQ